MAIEQAQNRVSREAAVDLSAKQYYIAAPSSGKAGLPGADGVRFLGVIQNAPAAGQPASIAVSGITHVVSDGSIVVDAPVAAKSGGKAKQAASGEYIIGIALEGDGGVNGAIISILILPQGRLP